jgi:hypothetical protein
MKQTTSKYQSTSKYQQSHSTPKYQSTSKYQQSHSTPKYQSTSKYQQSHSTPKEIISNNPYSIVNKINECYDNNPHECVDEALNMIVGLIKNDFIYKFVDFNELVKLKDANPDIYVIQINETTFAIPSYLGNDNKIYNVVFMEYDKETNEITDRINYDLVNEIHEDLNKILSIFDIPVNFKGIKHFVDGKLIPIPKFNCILQHAKLSINVLNRIIYEVFKNESDIALTYTEQNEYEQLHRQIDYEQDTIMFSTLIEYSKFIEKITTKSLFYVPDEFIVKG